MGGWIVSRIIDDQEPISYKFTPKFVLRGGQSVTVGVNKTMFGKMCELLRDQFSPDRNPK